MIRFTGRKDDGRRVIGLVLEPGNLEYLQRDRPILMDLGAMVPEFAGWDLLIGYTPKGADGVAAELIRQAKADGAKVHIIHEGPGDPQ